jgi:hypothetical protein
MLPLFHFFVDLSIKIQIQFNLYKQILKYNNKITPFPTSKEELNKIK